MSKSKIQNIEKIILATSNKHKVIEIKHILKGLKVELISLLDLKNVPKIVENRKTFEENALKKARIVARKYKLPTVSDDSGLEVLALAGKPGVRSARFAGKNPTSQKLCQKLLRSLRLHFDYAQCPRSGIEKSSGTERSRGARFVCCVALVLPDGKEKIIKGIVKGRIIDKMLGKNGFGYDPVFVPAGYRRTFAQMAPGFKNRISHRGQAFRKLFIALKKLT